MHFADVEPPKESSKMKHFNKIKEERQKILDKLRSPKVGLTISTKRVSTDLYVLIAADEERLMHCAEEIEMLVKMKVIFFFLKKKKNSHVPLEKIRTSMEVAMMNSRRESSNFTNLQSQSKAKRRRHHFLRVCSACISSKPYWKALKRNMDVAS